MITLDFTIAEQWLEQLPNHGWAIVGQWFGSCGAVVISNLAQ